MLYEVITQNNQRRYLAIRGEKVPDSPFGSARHEPGQPPQVADRRRIAAAHAGKRTMPHWAGGSRDRGVTRPPLQSA